MYFASVIRHINNSFLIFVIGALLVGLNKFSSPGDVDLFTWLFSCFYVFLRLKTYMDDYSYFKNAEINNANFKTGFLLAIISWLVWALSGYNVYLSNFNSLFLLGVSISISTIWIIADGLRKGATKEQYYWIGTNAIYVAILWSIHGFKDVLTPMQKLVLMGLLLLTLILDIYNQQKL